MKPQKRIIVKAELPQELYAMMKKEIARDYEATVSSIIRRALVSHYHEKAKDKP